MSWSYFNNGGMRVPLACLLSASLCLGRADAQVMNNMSLEGAVGSSVVPSSWTICGGSPDTQIIQGTGIGIFGINTPAANGSTYLGFVSTPGYIEQAGQTISWPVGTNLNGSVKLYRSTLHTNWNGFGQLRIWGGTSCASAPHLLWSSGQINNLNNWQTYPVSITVPANLTFVMFENNFFVGSGDMDYFCLDDIILNAVVLPVQLVNFAAQDHADRLQLDWELNGLDGNERMELEWSPDAQEFKTIAVEQPGFRDGVWQYQHRDATPGMNYYRLRILDQNGEVALSAIRQAPHTVDIVSQVHPNPAQGRINFSFDLAQDGDVAISLIDAAGRTVHTQRQAMRAGFQTLALDFPDAIAPGIYQLQAALGGGQVHHTVSIY